MVQRSRLTGECADRTAGIVTRAARRAIDSWRADGELRQTVASKPVQLVGLIVIDPSVEGVVVKLHGAGTGIVWLILRRRNVGCRNQLQKRGRLGSNTACRNHRSLEKRPSLVVGS